MNNPRTQITIKLYGNKVSCQQGYSSTETTEKTEKLYLNICNHFKRRGFKVGRDEKIFKEYPLIAKGYKRGFAANMYRGKCGVWPKGLHDIPQPPSPETLNYVKSRMIAFTHGRKRA